MWVQEGSDCKNSDDTVTGSSLFSGIYSISKPKPSISTIGIPMKPEPTLKSVVVSSPISPAQFLQNMNNDNKNNNDDTNIDLKDLKDLMEPEYDETEYADFADLAIVGKKLELNSIDNISDREQETKEMEIDTKMNFDDTAKEEKEESYISAKFDGLDIERWNEWNECLNFTKTNNGLLIIELYSSIFGASDVMYPFIHQHIEQNDKIQFVRLTINKMKEIDDIKQVILNYRSYELSPRSTYIFIKNGIKIDEIKGIKPTEFDDLINKYSKHQQVPQEPATNYGYPPIIKYKSILNQAASSNNKENKNVENIDTKYAYH